MAIESYTRTVKEVQDAVTRAFGDEAEIQVNSSDIIRWTNQAQLEIIIKNTTINEAMAVTDINQGQSKYPIAGDAAFADLNKIHTILINERPIINLNFQEAMTYIMDGDTGEGTPSIWYIKTGVLNLWPIPDTTITGGLTIYYTKKPAILTSAGDTLGVPDNFFNAIVEYVTSQAMEMDENWQAAGIKRQQFDTSVNSQQYQTIEQNAAFPTIIQDPEDYL